MKGYHQMTRSSKLISEDDNSIERMFEQVNQRLRRRLSSKLYHNVFGLYLALHEKIKLDLTGVRSGLGGGWL